ncbi:MAG: hypothetical protein GY861_21825 [bacterium]|nr:hypothetical protein [bacterium]
MIDFILIESVEMDPKKRLREVCNRLNESLSDDSIMDELDIVGFLPVGNLDVAVFYTTYPEIDSDLSDEG